MATSTEMQDLEVAVTGGRTVIESAILAFQGLATQIEAAAGDRAASLALAAEVRDQSADLAAAIPAGTPTPTPVP